MADSRGRQSCLPLDHRNYEKALLDWLHSSKQLVPKKRKDFTNFIFKHFDPKEFPPSVVRSVWLQLKNYEKKKKDCSTIVLSSDDEKPVVTEIFDFDALDSENEPNVTVVQLPQPVVKTPEKKRREQYKAPSCLKVKSTHSAEDQSLLKKFKRQIILEELLKRDKEMLKIQQSKDKLQTAVQIEMVYAKRVQKEHVDSLAQEMLRLHKAGFRDGLTTNSLSRSICLVDPPLVIPGQNVIAERLPSPDPHNEVLSQELSSDQINYEMLYPIDDAETSTSGEKKRKRSSDSSNVKRLKKKKCRSKSFNGEPYLYGKSKREIEADKLREKLYIDTLIEMALPEVVEEINGVHRLKRTDEINSY